MDSKPIHQPSRQKNEMLIFVLRSTSDDRRGWLMDSNRIHYPSPAKKWNAHFCITFNFWWLAGLVIGLEPHPPSVSSQKKWNAHFWITFNFWWSARLVDELESHLPPLSNQKNEVLIFGSCSTSDDWPGWSMDSNPIHHLSPAKEWNAHFRITLNFWWLARLVDGLEPNLPPLSNQKNEMLVFVLCSTSDDRRGWSMDSNRIHYPSPAKKWNAHFCITFNFWCLAGLVNGLEPHPPPLSSQKKWNAHFWITFNFWWSAGLVDELESHLPPLSNQKNEVLIFGLCSTSDDWPGWSMDSNPICHLSPAKEWNAHFWITFNFWWSVGLVNGLKPHAPPLSRQKNEMLIFGLHSISDDRLGWSMDSNPIRHPSLARKMKCLLLDYSQFLVISQAGQWTQTPSTTPLQPKNEMLIFGLCSTSDDRSGWSMDSNPICHPSPTKKMKCLFLYYVQLFMIGGAGRWTRTASITLLQPKNEMLVFVLHWTSDNRSGWSMDSNPICHPSPAKKMICSFLDYVQLLMIGQAGQWTWTPSATPLQPKKWNAYFWITFNFWWSARLAEGLQTHLQPLSNQKMKCLFLYYVIVQMISQAGRWTQSPSTTLQAKKMKC